MKKKFLILALICLLLSLVCGCGRGISKHLPGENEEDSKFVWVCKEPFGFFYLPDDDERRYYGFLKGHIWKDGKFVCFYSAYLNMDGNTYFNEITSFHEDKDWGSVYRNESFSGWGSYYKNDFYLYVEDDPMNFFDGKLPLLRFYKMTKEDFLEKYGDIKNISELLE